MTSRQAGSTQPEPQPMPGLQRFGEPLHLGALDCANGRREVIWASLAAAEVSWVAPVFLALNWFRNPHRPALLWLGLLILLLGYFYYYRALVAARLTLRLQQALSVLGLLLFIIFTLRFHVYAGLGLKGFEYFTMPFRHLTDVTAVMPSGWVTVMLLVYLWARAIHLANRSLSSDSVGFSFRSGVVVLIAFAFLIKIFTKLDLGGFVIPYFFFALLAVALARIDEVRMLPNSSRVPFTGFWIGSTVVAVAVLTFLGLLVAIFFTGGGLDRVLEWLSPVILLIQIALVGLGAFLLMLLDLIMTQLSLDLSVLGEGLRQILEQLGQLLLPPVETPPAASEAQGRPLIFGILQAAITLAIPAAMIALVLLFTWRRFRRERRDEGAAEARESLFTARAVARNLQAMLQDGLDRLAELAGQVGRLGLGSRFLAAVSIRRIYANLVRLAAQAGYPRSTAQTPYEYLSVLSEAFPDCEAEVTLITEAYVNAHYGQVPDTREGLERIRESWERVRIHAGRKRSRDAD